MASRQAEQPGFSMTSYPSSSYCCPNSSSTGFLTWSSQPSPYQAMTPWISYSSPSNPYSTSNTLVSATPYSFCQTSYRDSHYSDSASSAIFPALSQAPNPIHPSRQSSYDLSHNAEPKIESPVKLEEQSWEVSNFCDTLTRMESTDQVGKEDSARNQSFLASQSKIVTLDSLDLESISESKVLYYFGVLATKALLLPRFHFTSSRKSKYWGVKMTIYGMTFIRSHVYASRRVAKVSICKEALKKLKVEFPNWVVPERPKDSIAPPGWDWVETLHEYCTHQGLSEPKYTKYVHHKGYRHEVEVDGGTYFGSLKHYSDELQSKQGAAHIALYDVLVRDDSGRVESEGLPNLKISNKALLAQVPRDPLPAFTEPRVPARRRLEDYQESKRARRRTSKSEQPDTALQTCRQTPGNANLQPLENCRLAAVEATVVEEQRRWKFTPSEISRQLENVGTWVAKLEKICDLLALENPEIRIERTDGRLIETEGEYTAAAYFKNDPFLARAGAICQIKTFSGNRNAVHEACAKGVYDYLIDMVREDIAIEQRAAEEREAITRWGENAAK
ncbi:hypothetical protein BDW62DRAFT_89744 [Aspergillus aurantiobrunneus]